MSIMKYDWLCTKFESRTMVGTIWYKETSTVLLETIEQVA